MQLQFAIRGLLGADDRSILEYAFNDDRILVTANVGDFERFARACEVHAGIIFISEGDLLRERTDCDRQRSCRCNIQHFSG